ncbi:MAG: 16S rRNA (uracil(1498)-N(3))-methyltransferase [Bacteroidota bacterium]
MNLFYHPHIGLEDHQIVFEKDESRHISKVLRKSAGDLLHITNGKGDMFKAELVSVTPKQSIAKVIESNHHAPLPYKLHMAVAPTKNNDRFEWFLEKATEIGIHSITPIICDHSERKVVKPERFERILESAMKQSLKAYKPTLHPAVSFSDFLQEIRSLEVQKCIAHCSLGEKGTIKEVIPPKKDILMVIGPEGDFSSAEIKMAKTHGFKEITLGDSRLRTETAAIVACHSIAFINQL